MIRRQQSKAKGSRPTGYGDADEVQVTARIPRYLWEEIKKEAIDQRRSINAQVLVMLESVLATNVD